MFKPTHKMESSLAAVPYAKGAHPNDMGVEKDMSDSMVLGESFRNIHMKN